MQFSLWPIALNSCTEGHKIILYSGQISVNCSRKCVTVDFCASILNRVKQLIPSPERTDPIRSISQPPIKPLNAELNPICYLQVLLAHHFLHVSRIRVKSLTLRLLMSYIYIYIYIYIYTHTHTHTHGAPVLDVSRSHTTTQHSR